MKKNYLFMFCSFLLVVGISLVFSSCSSDVEEVTDSNGTYYVNQMKNVDSWLHDCEWVLVSYVTDQEEVKKEEKVYYYGLVFYDDGIITGNVYGNDVFGHYKITDRSFNVIDFGTTKMYWENADRDQFFLKYIRRVYTYKLTDTELRLYFAQGQYFKFRKTEVKHGKKPM